MLGAPMHVAPRHATAIAEKRTRIAMNTELFRIAEKRTRIAMDKIPQKKRLARGVLDIMARPRSLVKQPTITNELTN